MNRALLVAALLTVALAACNKKEEVSATALPAPAVAPTLPAATETSPEAAKPAEGVTLTLPTEQKPAAESKPAN